MAPPSQPASQQQQATTVTKLEVKLRRRKLGKRQASNERTNERGAERGGGELKKHQIVFTNCRTTTPTSLHHNEHSRRKLESLRTLSIVVIVELQRFTRELELEIRARAPPAQK